MIFISYRQEDTKAEVTHLSDRLIKRYGKDRIFVDFNNIPPGERWPDTIRKNLESCRILLAIVGPKWGEVRFGSGRKAGRLRLDDAEDWVRQEICTAINKGDDKMRVIVVPIDDAMLPETEWECELDELPKLQQARIRNKGDFEMDFNALCNWLEDHFSELKRPSATESFIEPSKDSFHEDLHRYVVSELRSHTSIQLPLISQNGHAIVAPINELRIDLPLILIHEHTPTDRQDIVLLWTGYELIFVHDQFRNTHTKALMVDRASRHQDIVRDFDIGQKLSAGSRLVMVGDPGCGKSTLLQWLSHYYESVFVMDGRTERSTDNNHLLPNNSWIPVLILCRDLAGQPFPPQLEDLLRIHLRLRHFPEPVIARLITQFDQLLERGEAMLLIDGLDEISNSEQRLQFCKLLTLVANRFPKAPIIVTSRVVGFQAVRDELSSRFDHLLVGPLDHSAKRSFIERWTKFIMWDKTKADELIYQVCHSRITAKLTDNIFLLAMIAQIRVLDEKLPDRRVDVFRRAVQLMIQRRRPFSGPPLSMNEVLPHMEFLAYQMRKQGLQRWNELEVLKAFFELRTLEPDESVLQTRDPNDLLRACIDSLGLLNVAGVEVDRRGFDRNIIQFFHQSFQEYFAGQAIIHGHGVIEHEGVVSRLRNLLESIQVQQHEVIIRGKYSISEPVIADYWQEAVRSAIADLKPEVANDALLMILPDSNTPISEARPRTIFALQCLADEPKVNLQTVSAVFDVMLDNLIENDGINNNINTGMDEAIAAVAESTWSSLLHERMLVEYLNSRDEQRHRVGCCLALCFVDKSPVTKENIENLIEAVRVGLAADQQIKRVQAALELSNRFYATDGKLGFLTINQRKLLIDSLLNALSTDEATEFTVIWALLWLTGARIRLQGDDLTNFIQLEPSVISTLEAILQRPNIDSKLLNWGCPTLTRDQTIRPVVHQLDWIYELAIIADGVKPRRVFPHPSPTGRLASVDWLLSRLQSERSPDTSCRIAQTLGAFGVFVPEMAESLGYMFQHPKFVDAERDEALIYLGMIASEKAIQIIVEAADTPPIDNDDYLYSRGLFGLLLANNIEVLAKQIRKALPHSDLECYAYGLIGSEDPRGRKMLSDLKQHPDERIRRAVTKAFQKAATWK